MNSKGTQVFHRGAVVAWGRSIGITDAIAISFMKQAGVIIIDDSEPSKPER